MTGPSGAYRGGVAALFVMLLFFDDGAGKTLIGLQPAFGLNPEEREGTRAVGPFIVIWFALFIIPFFLWNREPGARSDRRPTSAEVWGNLKDTIRTVFRRKSLGNFLLSSMLYRDALNAVYSFGGIYAALVLGWQTIQIGVFGIVAAIAAAILTWVGGLFDQKLGPKPVIVVSCWVLVLVSTVIVGMSRESLFGLPLAPGSLVPDIIFYVCGALIGGAGGASYSASRTMMVRHSHPDRPGEAFGLFALTGKATAFLAPALITLFTIMTGSNQLGFLPVIALFLIGLFLLRFVNKDGDRAAWSGSSPQSP
jgi:MFS transporter, UMF1 family